VYDGVKELALEATTRLWRRRQQTTTIWSFCAGWRLGTTKLNTKASASTGYQTYQSTLNQAHDLSLLAPTIQADALKKRAIQANASAWIGLIVDKYDRDPIFFGASDASFADEVETRRSSQGYVFQLFGMTVDWKSALQRTVTKSTTEAELLALSLAGSEMEEWCGLFKGLSLKLNQTPIIWCDNQQTVGIVTKEQDKLSTKLKHVDIHQSWSRQEVEEHRLHVQWEIHEPDVSRRHDEDASATEAHRIRTASTPCRHSFKGS
jgi:hypothetical protein